MEVLRSNTKVGQRYTLSAGDIRQVQMFYRCAGSGKALPPAVTPAPPSSSNASVITTIYSSELTKSTPTYARTGGAAGNYYYETIQVTVPVAGVFLFESKSNIDTYASVYFTPFNASNPSANVKAQFDDQGDGTNWLFKFSVNFGGAGSIILVVTTYGPNVTGPYSIVATGPGKVTFVRTSNNVPLTTTTTTAAPSTSSANLTLSSQLTNSSQRFARVGGSGANYRYEAIEVTVSKTGTYTFSSRGFIDTYFYCYSTSFNATNPSVNLLGQDHNSGSNGQFNYAVSMTAGTKYVLVVTTNSPNVIGAYAYVASGPSTVSFVRVLS